MAEPSQQDYTRPPKKEYYQPPKKRGSSFWKITTGVVFVALVIMLAWTFLTKDSSKQEPTAALENKIGSDETKADQADPNSDTDQDGLTYQDEQKYGTNPEEADTDKDGYTDGEEVKNGYNPNGAGRLTLDAPKQSEDTSDSNTTYIAPEMTGIPLEKVFSGTGSYICKVTGGQAEQNTVTVKVLNNKMRQETPVKDSVLVMIVHDQKTMYMSGFQGGKYLQLTLNPATGVASGQGATVKGGIFANASLILATSPTSISCEESSLKAEEFEISPDLIIKPGDNL